MGDDQVNLLGSEHRGRSLGLSIGDPVGSSSINAALLMSVCVQGSATESYGDVAELSGRPARLKHDILLVGPTTSSAVIYALTKPCMVFVISVDDVQRNRKSEGAAIPQGDWRILFEEAEISDLNCCFDLVLGISLGDAI